MREIKFRAWDKKFNKFISYVARAISGDLLQSNGSWRHANEIEWLEHTGLKDKNGVEIYEGDVILSYDTLRIDRKQEKYRQTVEWSAEYAGFLPFCDYDADCGAYIDMDTVEVIGNIYEESDERKESKK